jgi:hypothetical protein
MDLSDDGLYAVAEDKDEEIQRLHATSTIIQAWAMVLRAVRDASRAESSAELFGLRAQLAECTRENEALRKALRAHVSDVASDGVMGWSDSARDELG